MAEVDPFKHVSTSRVRKKPARYEPIEKGRKVAIHRVSTTEMLGISILNPLGAAGIGWGINLHCTAAGMPDGQAKEMMRVTAVGALVFGSLAQLMTWGFFLIVWFQSRERTERVALAGREKEAVDAPGNV